MKKQRLFSLLLTASLAITTLAGCQTQKNTDADTQEAEVSQVIDFSNATEGGEEIANLYADDGYHLLWNDEFNSDELNQEHWNIELRDPGWTNNELQEYTSSKENVYLKDGCLILKPVKTKDEKGLTYYTSGKVNSKGKRQFLYGKVTARAKVPAGQGFWPAIWMMPQDESFYGQWPRCGEIDIMEILGNQTNILYSNIHYGVPHGENQGTYIMPEGTFSGDFHEFSLEWEPDEMRFYIDGKLFHTINNWYTGEEGEDTITYPAPFDQPFYLQMNLAVGGDWPGRPDGTTNFETAEFAIDYVRVYQKDSYDTNVKSPGSIMRDPDDTGNFVNNADFSEAEDLTDDENWKFILMEGGNGTAAIENNEIIITSTNAGNQEYSVQLVQPNMPMEQGGVYRVTFEAMAEEERNMKVAVTAPEKSWIRYLEDTSLTMTTDWQPYEYEFTIEGENDAKGRLEFNMGNQGSTATIHIRNVRLEKTGTKEIAAAETEKTLQSDGNYVYNGTFQYGDGRMKYWEVTNSLTDSLVEVTNENLVRQLHAQVADGADDLTQLQVTQTGLALTGGIAYNLTFDAYGDKKQKIQVCIGSQTFDVSLSDKMSGYSFSFELPEGEARPNLIFLLGTPGNIYIDNVKIKEDGALINASFSSGLTGWSAFTDSTLSEDVTYAVDSLAEDSAAGFTINNTGSENWMIQLMQKNIALYKGKTYRITFDAKSSIDRKIQFAAQKDGSSDDIWTEYGINTYDLTSEYQTYTLEFTMEENNMAAMITFSMGAIDGETIEESHVIYIDNVVLEEK